MMPLMMSLGMSCATGTPLMVRRGEHGDHVVAVAAEHHGAHVLDRDAGLAGQEELKARRVEHAGHADHALFGELGAALELVDHGVERIGDDDEERVRAVFFGVVGDVADDGQVDGDEVVAALPGLARHAGGHDDDVGAGAVGPVGRADRPRRRSRGRRGSARDRAPCPWRSFPSRRCRRARRRRAAWRTARLASSPPMLPAPINAIFFRLDMTNSPGR